MRDRVMALAQAQLWDMRRNAMVIFSPALMFFMNLIYWAVGREKLSAIFAPMVLSLCTYMVGLQILAMIVAEEKEKRTLEALLLTPVRPFEIATAKIIVSAGVTVAVTAVCMLFWGVPERPLWVATGFVLGLTFALALGFWLGSVVPDTRSVGFATPAWILLYFTGFPLFAQLTPALWKVMSYLPSRPVVTMLSAGWNSEVQPGIKDVVVVLVYAALVLWMGARQLRRQATAL